jgi:phage tail sheath protein FI
MPEYLAPGVYVEETSFRSKSIEGVSTTTTGFVGPSRYGPTDLEPDVVTSVTEFERTYGDRERLQFSDFPDTDNYLWHGARAFFEEGGKRLYIARVFHRLTKDSADDGVYARPKFNEDGERVGADYLDGHARAEVAGGGAEGPIRITARFPGAAGNMRVRLTLRVGQSVLGTEDDDSPKVSVLDKDIVVINQGTTGALYEAMKYFDVTQGRQSWKFLPVAGGTELLLTNLVPDPDPLVTDLVRIVTVSVRVTPTGRGESDLVWDGLALHPKHERAGAPDSLVKKFDEKPSSLGEARTLPIVITLDNKLSDGLKVLDTIESAESPVLSPPGDRQMSMREALLTKPLANTRVTAATPAPLQPTDADLSVEVLLAGGNDGQRPTADDYKGAEKDKRKSGLVAFEDIEDISIVAAPGSTYRLNNGYRSSGTSIINYLISHAQRMRYRIAVLDSGDDQSISEVRALRGKIDSTYAALYYPWIRVLDPVTGTERNMPPSGFVAGIYARNDINRAVFKAPANEVVFSAIGFEQLLNKSQQDVLNPEGINCFRYFSGRGFRLWGARTISSDPEWKYVNLRRYFVYLEHSIDRGTQWAVFEPNGEGLWANVRRTVEDFLLNEWQMGALLGDKPEKAFFVKCDRSTMSQNDLDNGRLVCLVGVAPLRPAEYVIFRIGQWTADRKV